MNNKVLKGVIVCLFLILVISSNIFADKIGDLLTSIGVDVLPQPKPAPDFTLNSLSGTPTTMSELNDDLIMVNFWATWCGTCGKEAPYKDQLWDLLADYEGGNGFEMLCLNYKEATSDVINYMQTKGYDFPVYLDKDGSVRTSFGIEAVPYSFLIIDHQIVGMVMGDLMWNDPQVVKVLKEVIDLINPPLTNVALNKKVFASGQFSADFPKTAVNDGNENSIWGSLYNAGNQWIFIDIGSEVTVTQVVAKFFNPYFSPNYFVGVSSDAKTWNLLAEITNGDGDIDTIPLPAGTTARYVGVLLTKGAKKVYGLKELEIYAP